MNQSLERSSSQGGSCGNEHLQTMSMKPSIERRALLWALLCASVSLGGALLIATPIQRMSSWAFFTGGASSGIAASPEVLAQGAGFFAQSCADCHGDDAHGDEGPDLHSLAISNARIAAQIKNGTKGEMPSFSKKYNDQQIATIVAYVRSLR